MGSEVTGQGWRVRNVRFFTSAWKPADRVTEGYQHTWAQLTPTGCLVRADPPPFTPLPRATFTRKSRSPERPRVCYTADRVLPAARQGHV